MIAHVTKLIRRHVAAIPTGELLVALIPPIHPTTSPTIEIGIKGGKATDRIKIDIVQYWFEKSSGPSIEPAIEAKTEIKELTEKEEITFIHRIRTKLLAAVHSDDQKVGYRAAANIDKVLAEELRNYTGNAVHSD